MRLVLASVILLAGAVTPTMAQAQSVPDARAIVFEHDGRDTTGYALYVQRDRRKEQRIDLGYVAPDAAGLVHLPLPKLAAGTYRLAIVAYNGKANTESSRIFVPPIRIAGGDQADQAPKRAESQDSVPNPPRAAPSDPVPAPAHASGSARRSGILGRIWRILVGDDTP